MLATWDRRPFRISTSPAPPPRHRHCRVQRAESGVRMAERRWTVMLVPHGDGSSRSFSISANILRLAVGIAVVVGASFLGAAIGVVTRTVNVARSERLQNENAALSHELARMDQRIGALSDTLAVISRRDEQVRLVAGLEPLDPDVRKAG